MSLIFNLDLDNRHKVTNYAFDIIDIPPVIYYRLYRDGYALDMNDFDRLTIRYKVDNPYGIYTRNYIATEIINGEELVKVNLDSQIFAQKGKIFSSPTVKISNKSIILKDFQFLIYDGKSQEMNAVKQALMRLNQMYYQYIKSVKKDQINQPNGVVGLGSDGKIPMDKLNLDITKHVFDKVFNTDVHGLRMNDNFELELHEGDDVWSIANSIHGSTWDSPNKDGKEIFGGTFTSVDSKETIFGGIFRQN